MLFDLWKYIHSESLINTLGTKYSDNVIVTKNVLFFFEELQLITILLLILDS